MVYPIIISERLHLKIYKRYFLHSKAVPPWVNRRVVRGTCTINTSLPVFTENN